jgi:glycosyltransferase involved in cell wall biosynthesis
MLRASFAAHDMALRYAYIKNGDAVSQARRIVSGEYDASGPNAFIGDFMRAHARDELLILCEWHSTEEFRAERVHAQSYSMGRSGLSRLWLRIWSMFAIGFRLLRWRPDRIVCGCIGEQLWISVLVAKLLRVPIVCTRHSGLVERKGVRGFTPWLDRLSIRACDGVATHGPFLAAQVAALGVSPAQIHEFDVDLRDFGRRPSEHALSAEHAALLEQFPFVFMYVGRIQADKGVLDLLEAFSLLREVNAGLVYIGTGKDSNALTRAVEKHGLGSRVRLLGALPHAQLAALARRANAIVTPTRPDLIEGRCMVALESLVLGVPVIAPDFAAFPYVVRHGANGLLYQPGNIDALAAAMREIATSPQRLADLRAGAIRSGDQLRSESTSFSRAVDAAFPTAAES